ncbi:MAG: CocE/NonD family hydrolase [Marinomonas sp.]|uniref:CocE/NonD family hydrolase n=1 Tax=Marinomonas sp. TaxID=1904862 RepID=UPI003C786EE4
MEPVRQIHHAMLPLPDGTQLAYRAWLPEGAESKPVPAILEFLPYRRNDGTIVRDEITMAQTAAHGYACVRVDLRGCGESQGHTTDEYTAQELDDGVDIIAWLSDQSWCDGNVGMVGISWGGFNALQVAALNPPSLKAIITQCSTDDRYGNDVHYMGGCLLNDNLDWAAFFWAYAQGRAPDKRLLGDGWKEQWLDRLEMMPFLAKPWLTEQTRNDYWKHGSVCEDYSQIKVPVYTMGGWADNYRRSVFSLLENLDVPRKGLIGPWAHKYPNIAYPNPKMDYVKESVRWWDRWLKGLENGIDNEPQLTYYLQDSVRPKGDYEHRSGQWLSEPCWPSPRTSHKSFYLNNRQLLETPQPTALAEKICSPQTLGLNGGRLCVGIRLQMEQPADQRADDAGSLCFDSAPLLEDMALAGDVVANLAVRSDKPNANIAVRICDVHPDGAVTRISVGVLNLNHRNNHELFESLIPNELNQVQVKVNPIAYKLPAGHRLRVSISTAYWPLIWPSSDHATLTIEAAQSSVQVAVRNELFTEVEPPQYDEPVSYDGYALRDSDSQRFVHHDYKTGVVTLETHDDFGRQHYNSCDTDIDMSMSQWQSIHPEDPLSAQSKITFDLTMGREGWWTGLKGDYQMRCDRENFYITSHWRAFHEGEQVFSKEFEEIIKRTGV